jgi:hypothetical protein
MIDARFGGCQLFDFFSIRACQGRYRRCHSVGQDNAQSSQSGVAVIESPEVVEQVG